MHRISLSVCVGFCLLPPLTYSASSIYNKFLREKLYALIVFKCTQARKLTNHSLADNKFKMNMDAVKVEDTMLVISALFV